MSDLVGTPEYRFQDAAHVNLSLAAVSNSPIIYRAIQFDGVVLSTDDYFTKGDMYEYDPDKLTEAHQWNRERGT